jgi:hypothetical protein
MDIFESGIPNLRITAKRSQFQFIETTTVLEAWNGYMKNYRNETRVTDGTVKLDFGGYNVEDKSIDWQPQINAYHHLLENQYAVRDSILRALSEEVGRFTQYLDPDDSFVPNITPETRGCFDFKPFIGPVSVSFDEEESRNGVSYLQWHFDCAWDVEHGLAAITHEDRVIDLDRGETDIWKIYADNGTLAEKQKEYEERAKNFKPPKRQKPWWRFW